MYLFLIRTNAWSEVRPGESELDAYNNMCMDIEGESYDEIPDDESVDLLSFGLIFEKFDSLSFDTSRLVKTKCGHFIGAFGRCYEFKGFVTCKGTDWVLCKPHEIEDGLDEGNCTYICEDERNVLCDLLPLKIDTNYGIKEV